MSQFSPSTVMTIEGRQIGPEHPVFIIAEIGVNHNGDMALAKRTIDAAVEAGADCVKFQSFRAEEFMSDQNLVYGYENNGTTVRENMFDMFKRLEFPLESHHEIFDYARRRGVVPLTSVADPVCADGAMDAGVGAFKLSSEDLINRPLLDHVCGKGLPLLLSTGMADGQEIDDVLAVLARHGTREVLFFHCVSLYPTEDREANLLRMGTLATRTGAMVGYSDHTRGEHACIAAASLGACALEKHFTLDTSLPGPDHALSADPAEFRRLVDGVRRVELMLGDPTLGPGGREAAIRNTFRRSVVAARDLPRGTRLMAGDLAIRRPGTGVHPREMERMTGMTLTSPVRENEQIDWDMLTR